MFTYLIINLVSFLSAFISALFFEKRIRFLANIKFMLLASFITSIPFLIWDYFFTLKGIWGFEDKYLIGTKILNLPMEEILFFLTIPFSSTFIYVCVKYLFKKTFELKLSKLILALVGTCNLGFIIFFSERSYTFVVGIFSILTCIYAWVKYKQEHIGYFLMGYLISLIPFLIVNGILTNGLSDGPIVWYNNNENLNFRIGSIPIEDFFYSFVLLYWNSFIYERLSK